MNAELIKDIEQYVRQNISKFHQSRINKLASLKLDSLLRKKNPYLYKAKDLNTPGEVVESIASAFMSSAEETMFGDWLEGLAIFVASRVYGGVKSTSEGIDLEMDKDGIHYIVSIKSGPNWSNSSSMAKLKQNFQKAQRIYRTSGNKNACEPIEGCCYGKKKSAPDATHTKLCGQAFWEFISGSDTLYTDIIEPLGCEAHKKNVEYKKEYDKMITKFTKSFSEKYTDNDGNILWELIVRVNSAKASDKEKQSID